MTERPALAAAVLLLALSPLPALAQTCRLPDRIQPAPAKPPPKGEVSKTRADHHVLAISWSPEHCRTSRDPLQCRDNSFGFVLHGLWPSARSGPHPRYCAAAPPLAPATVRRHLCMTPSVDLLQHEWAAHGTCGWTSPEAYFQQAASLMRGLRLPDLPGRSMTAGELRGLFVAANPGLHRNAIRIKVTSGNRFEEVGICYDLKYRPIACPTGVGTPDKVVIRVTPRAGQRALARNG